MKTIAHKLFFIVFGSVLLTGAAAGVTRAETNGEIRIGGVIRDDYGSAAAYMPSQQIYDGFLLSLDQFRYADDRGWRLSARGRNLTLNSRDLSVALGHRSLFSLNLRNDQSTRRYTGDGSKYGRRHLTDISGWLQPVSILRLYGSATIQNRTGVILSGLFPTDSIARSSTAFQEQLWRGGVRLEKDGYLVEADLRVRNYDDRDSLNRDREGRRYRISGRAPVPSLANLFVEGGFMQYVEAYHTIPASPDSFLTNTGWGGIRWAEPQGGSFKYSFVYDRSRRVGDLLATDNIIQSLQLGKNWKNKGGLTVGGEYRYRDNLTTVLESFGFGTSAWLVIGHGLTLRGFVGTEHRDVNEGQLINGVRATNKGFAQADYRLTPLNLRLRYSRESRSYDDLGTTNDFDQVSFDGSWSTAKLGDFSGSYAFRRADQQSRDGRYRYDEHIVTGEFLSAAFGKWHGTLSGLYQRSTGDIAVETGNGSAGLRYDVTRHAALDARYSAYNFDNYTQRDLPHTPYTDYTTANIIELSLVLSW